MKEYVIQFSGLKSGEYTYEFELGKCFFKGLESEDLRGGDVKLTVFLRKSETMLIFDFDFEGIVRCLCDRCLAEFSLPIKEKHSLFVKFGDKYEEIDDEVVVLPEKEHQIDLAIFIYDFLMVSLPLKKTHELDAEGNTECDKEMIYKIQSIQKREEEIDPRWEKLKILKNNE